jgi:hypothetical protein
VSCGRQNASTDNHKSERVKKSFRNDEMTGVRRSNTDLDKTRS